MRPVRKRKGTPDRKAGKVFFNELDGGDSAWHFPILQFPTPHGGMEVPACSPRPSKAGELEIAIRKTDVGKDLGRVPSKEEGSSVALGLAKPRRAFAAVASHDASCTPRHLIKYPVHTRKIQYFLPNVSKDRIFCQILLQ
jgi:hypothetical protein